MYCFRDSKCNGSLSTGRIKHMLDQAIGFERKLLLCCSIRLGLVLVFFFCAIPNVTLGSVTDF